MLWVSRYIIIMEIAPVLSPRLWYGCLLMSRTVKSSAFRGTTTEGYMTLGFFEDANLDQDHMWPTSFALDELTATEEEKIKALVKKSVNL